MEFLLQSKIALIPSKKGLGLLQSKIALIPSKKELGLTVMSERMVMFKNPTYIYRNHAL